MSLCGASLFFVPVACVCINSRDSRSSTRVRRAPVGSVAMDLPILASHLDRAQRAFAADRRVLSELKDRTATLDSAYRRDRPLDKQIRTEWEGVQGAGRTEQLAEAELVRTN